MRRLLFSLLTLLAVIPAMTAQTFRRADPVGEAKELLGSMPLHPVEGLWQFPGQDGVIEIIRENPQGGENVAVYKMVVLSSENRSVRPGTVIGTLRPMGKYGVYDSRICTSLASGRNLTPSRPKKYVLTLEDGESRLIMKDYGRKLRFRWWRLLPFMFRRPFTEEVSRPGAIEGLVRIFPEPSMPLNPVYL